MPEQDTITIKTERLVLRPLTLADAARLARLADHAEIASKLATMPHPYDERDALDFITRVRAAPAGAACFAITLKDEGGLIGTCGYGPAHGRPGDTPPETDFGYWLGLDYWGKGYATEAAGAVVAHAFERSGIAVLTTDYQIGNEASKRVLVRLGFRLLGARRRHSLGSGGEVETMQVELAEKDWRASRGAGR